jgi:hypothetical protein
VDDDDEDDSIVDETIQPGHDDDDDDVVVAVERWMALLVICDGTKPFVVETVVRAAATRAAATNTNRLHDILVDDVIMVMNLLFTSTVQCKQALMDGGCQSRQYC